MMLGEASRRRGGRPGGAKEKGAEGVVRLAGAL